VKGKSIVFTTTNGTRAIDVAKDCKELIIGSFPNISAVAERCIKSAERIVVLCAGWNNRINIEDTLFGGAFAEKLIEMTNVEFNSDAIKMSYKLWLKVKGNLNEFIQVSDHYKRLRDNGAVGDTEYCLTPNSISKVLIYNKIDGMIY
ncbi:MAG TPA: 2-phosphosulfolactate phosphatase, partial [Fermentimonas sp.]|nr:2-phosphosulfolactate phosphatase [Fermentimonas sp.]